MSSSLNQAADEFYAAGNRFLAGDPFAFAAIWSEADDISHLGPMGERRTGRQAVMEGLRANQSRMGFRGTLVGDARQLIEVGDMGLLVCIERTSRITHAGETIQQDIRSTTLFRREQGQRWVVHHYADPLQGL